MEYANAGDLADIIQKRQAEKKPLQEDEIMFMYVLCISVVSLCVRVGRRL